MALYIYIYISYVGVLACVCGAGVIRTTVIEKYISKFILG